MLVRRRDLFEILGVTVVAGNHTVPQGGRAHAAPAGADRCGGRAPVPRCAGTAGQHGGTGRPAGRRPGDPSRSRAPSRPSPGVRPPHGGRFASSRPRSSDAVAFLIESIERHPNEVTLVALGPLTNVALALRRPAGTWRPASAAWSSWAANARVPGNVTPAAEFNFWFDPEAAAEVLAAPIPRVVMFGLDITNHAPLHKTRFDRIVAVDTPLTRLNAARHGAAVRRRSGPRQRTSGTASPPRGSSIRPSSPGRNGCRSRSTRPSGRLTAQPWSALTAQTAAGTSK